MKNTLVVSTYIAILVLFSNCGQNKQEVNRQTIADKEYKTMVFKSEYREVYPEVKFENLQMIGNIGKFGVYGNEAKLLRVLRFENITNAVEMRYNLPTHLLLAMLLEESNGVELLPNGKGDGGFGWIHMQPKTALEFGLVTYKNCKGMVCDGHDSRSCKDRKGNKYDHAEELENIIKKHHYDRKSVMTYDDRLQPLTNIDAAGRMIAYYMRSCIKELDPFETAIARYAGATNFRNYLADVKSNMKLLNDEEFLRKVEKTFNEKNPNLLINGEHGDFASYIKASQEQNYNYGLGEYEKLPYLMPKNSDKLLASIQ